MISLLAGFPWGSWCFFPWVPTIRLTLPTKWTSNNSLKSGCLKKDACLDDMLYWQDSEACCQKLHCTEQGDVSSAQISFMLKMHGEFFFLGHSPYIVSVVPCFGGSFVHYHPFFFGLMHKLTPLLTKDHKNKPQTTSSIGFLLVLIRSDLRNFTWTITTHRLNHMIQGWWSTPVPSLAAYLVTIVCLICPPPQWKIAMSSRQARRCISRRLHLPRYRDAERCSNSEGF